MDSFTTKLAVRDSLDDEDLSDVDDEVFIRDGKNGSKLIEDRGVKRPLMAPRRKAYKEGLRNRHPPCRIKCVFYCYAIVALLVLLGLIGLTVLLVSLYPLPMDRFRPWFSSAPSNNPNQNLLRPCTSFRVTNLWNVTMMKRSTESPIRSLDVNGDGFDDIIFGFQTENGEEPFPYLCDIYFDLKQPCQGGVTALDGKTGAILWEHWSAHPVYYLDCTADLNSDNHLDCVAMGRSSLLCGLNGVNGSLIWQYSRKYVEFLVGKTISDQDGDNVPDIIVSQTLRRHKTRTGALVMISGKTGSPIAEVSTPENRETYFMPQVLRNSGSKGNGSILFATGGQDSVGALYIIPLNAFKSKPRLLYKDRFKGLLTPAVIVDLTDDGVEDIVFSTFNGSVVAMSGATFEQLWNYTFNSSEISSAIVPGFFNDDNVTDFMVKFNIGNGFPEYFYAQTLLLDGKTGIDLLHKWVIDSAPSDLAGLSISLESSGLDLYLYWMGVCKGFEDSTIVFDEFNFVLGNSVWARSRADICNLRFNSTLILKLYALNHYEEPPGILIYTTENLEYEYNKTTSPLYEAKKYVEEHPDFEFEQRQLDLQSPLEIIPAEESLFPTVYRKDGSSFRHKTSGEDRIKLVTEHNPPHGASQHIHTEGDNWASDWSNRDQYVQENTRLDSSSENDEFEDDVGSDTYLNQQNRDPRSKSPPHKNSSILNDPTVRKRILTPEQYNEYQTAENAKNRLLHDLNNLPNEIIRDTFLVNIEREMEQNLAARTGRFEQRDLRYRNGDGVMSRTVKKQLEHLYDDVKLQKQPETLWDLESEKEKTDKDHGYWRGKREMINGIKYIPKINNPGILMPQLKKSDNSIDYVFAKFWTPVQNMEQIMLPKDKECVAAKLEAAKETDDEYYHLEKSTQIDMFVKMCLKDRGVSLKEKIFQESGNSKIDESLYLKDINQLSLGVLTIQRLNIQCDCGPLLEYEQCGRILNHKDQRWSEYMGNRGDGYF